MDPIIEKTIKGLRSHNMTGYFVKDEQELRELLQNLIPKGSIVGCGDSITLEQTGVFDFLRSGDYTFS